MRPHQKEGVQFLFDCILGYREGLAGHGCILADEMYVFISGLTSVGA